MGGGAMRRLMAGRGTVEKMVRALQICVCVCGVQFVNPISKRCFFRLGNLGIAIEGPLPAWMPK